MKSKMDQKAAVLGRLPSPPPRRVMESRNDRRMRTRPQHKIALRGEW